MSFEDVTLVVTGVLAAAGAIGVVTCRQTLYSALSLVFNVAMLAVMFLVLNAQFLFAVQLIVYAGAVMVLFVFIIALLSPGGDERPAMDGKFAIGLLGIAVITFAVAYLANASGTVHQVAGGGSQLNGQMLGSANDPYHSFSFDYSSVNTNGNVQTVAGQLFTTYLLPFEMTSLLLFVAAIGAVYLTRRDRPSARRRPVEP